MGRFCVATLCFLGLFAGAARAQSSSIQPIHAAAGAVLTFHLQTLLNPVNGDPLDALPEGTVLRVKLLDSIDSHVNHDGDVFRASLISPLISGKGVLIHAGAEVRGLLALLRSRNHPEGFRYELLVTGITDGGKSYALTASLDPSLFDAESQSPSSAGAKANSGSASDSKLPENIHN
jgi:hypothetical protein